MSNTKYKTAEIMGSPTQAQQEEKAGSVKMFLGISVVAFVIALVVFVLMVSGTIGKIRKSARSRLAGTVLDPEYKTAEQTQISELQKQLESAKRAQAELASKTMAAQANLASMPTSLSEIAARQQKEAQAALAAQQEAAARAALQAEASQEKLRQAQQVLGVGTDDKPQTWGQWFQSFGRGN